MNSHYLLLQQQVSRSDKLVLGKEVGFSAFLLRLPSSLLHSVPQARNQSFGQITISSTQESRECGKAGWGSGTSPGQEKFT